MFFVVSMFVIELGSRMTFIMLVNVCSAIRVTIIISCTDSVYRDNLGQSVRGGGGCCKSRG